MSYQHIHLRDRNLLFGRGEGLHHQRPSKPSCCLFHITPVIPNRHLTPHPFCFLSTTHNLP